MAQNIIRTQRLSELDNLLQQCSGYLCANPDPFAAARVAHLDKNPCITGNYYVNAIYKEIHNEQVTDIQTLSQFKMTKTQHISFYDQTYKLQVYIKVDPGLWQPYKLYGPYNSIDQAYTFVQSLQNNTLKELEDYVIYIDFTTFFQQFGKKVLDASLLDTEYISENNINGQKIQRAKDAQNIIYYINLSSQQKQYFELTTNIIDNTVNGNLLQIQDGVVKVQELLNFSILKNVVSSKQIQYFNQCKKNKYEAFRRVFVRKRTHEQFSPYISYYNNHKIQFNGLQDYFNSYVWRKYFWIDRKKYTIVFTKWFF